MRSVAPRAYPATASDTQMSRCGSASIRLLTASSGSCAVRDDEVEGGQRGRPEKRAAGKRAEPVTLVGQIHVDEIGLQLTEPAAKPERGSRMGNTAQPGDALDGRARRDQALVDLARRSISEQGVEPATIAQGCNERLEIQLRATDASGIGYECYERVAHVLPASRVRPGRRIECTARELWAPGSPDTDGCDDEDAQGGNQSTERDFAFRSRAGGRSTRGVFGSLMTSLQLNFGVAGAADDPPSGQTRVADGHRGPGCIQVHNSMTVEYGGVVGKTVQPTYITVTDDRYFLGAVALVNSLRLAGNDGIIIILDAGLSDYQRNRLSAHCEIRPVPVDRRGVIPTYFKPTISKLGLHGVVVFLDSDIIVTGSLEPLYAPATEGAICAFPDGAPERHFEEWRD